jgi:DNA-binding NarL/FixJ family response regulator
MNPISFILIEDHALFRSSVTEVLEDSQRYQCVGSFSNMEEALSNVRPDLQPDLVLLDLGLPGISGLDGIRLIREGLPNARLFILTAFHDRERVFAALKAGAHGYIIKTGGSLKVLRTLDDVASGGVPLDPLIAGMVLQTFQQLSPACTPIVLSDQEIQVLCRISKGMTVKKAAQDMKLSSHTVDNYVRRAFEKLHVQSLPAAVAAAIRNGLLEAE